MCWWRISPGYGGASRRIIEAERLDVVSNLTHLIDRQIKATSGLLTGIATSAGLQAGNPEMQHRVTNVVFGADFVGLGAFDPSNRLMFSEPAIRPAFADPGAAGVAAILGGQEFHVSNLVTVGDAKPGLRDAWSADVVDRKGIMLARSQRPEAFVGQLAQAPMVQASAGDATSGLFDDVSRDGIDMKNVFEHDPEVGRTVGAAVPAAVVNAPLWKTALTMAAIGPGFILLSVPLGSLVASRIAYGVHQLSHAAVGLASGASCPWL